MNKVKKFFYSQKAAPYVFVLPFVLTVLLFWIFPIGNGVLLSYSIGKPRYRIFRTFPDQMAERPVDRIFCAASGSLLEMDRCKYSLFPCRITEYFHGFIRGSIHRRCVQMAAVQKNLLSACETNNRIRADHQYLCRSVHVPGKLHVMEGKQLTAEYRSYHCGISVPPGY